MQNGEFVLFADALHRHVVDMVKGETHLFRTDVTKDEMWEHYLNSFPEGSNPVFRERREFDCGCCRQFIKSFGNVVAIKDNKVVTIWEDIEIIEYPYNIVAAAMTEYIKSKPVCEVFVSRETKFGTKSNKEMGKDGNVVTWHHFYTELPAAFAITRGTSPESVMAEYRSAKEVFERSMLELTEEAGAVILELIQQGSLYRGEEHKRAVETFLDFKRKFVKVPDAERNNWLWKTSIDNPVSRIRNTAIGTLLIDLSSDVDVDEAVTKFEKVMAPTNYKRPKAIFTKRMVEEAEKTLVELGMVESLERRHAVLSDITVNNVLFVNRDAKKKMEGSSVLASLKEDTAVVNPKNFNRVEEIAIQDFIKNVMPGSKRIELLMEGRLRGNLMSLVAPKFKDAKSMFRWGNNFSWSYNGDVTDSMMKANVEKAGGRVDGILRFSIQWNDNEKKPNGNDYDAHCKGPEGEHIYYGSKRGYTTGGVLDVDIQMPHGIAVENITWANFSTLKEGDYTFKVHNYHHRGGTDGFDAELEFDGQVHHFSYRKDLKHKCDVEVAVVRYDRKTGFSLVRSLDSTLSVKQIWGITTNKWVDVSTIMFSPNYWDEQTGRGNRHFFFMLEGCRNEGTPRGFYNEFLKEDLNKHKRVFEALGGRAAVKDSEEQLSGVGFSETQRNSVFVKVEGTVSRILKINF